MSHNNFYTKMVIILIFGAKFQVYAENRIEYLLASLANLKNETFLVIFQHCVLCLLAG